MKQHWKFLLLGITGDLSAKKILPGIAEFAAKNKDEVEIELYGYSRSKPDENKIRALLASYGGDETVIPHISYVQGDYADNSFFHELIGTLQEGQRLVVYLAVPPSVFLKFLQNSCPYSSKPIDILIEKPFGTSATEAQNILDVVKACDLHRNVHFCDHYLFKHGTFLPAQAKAALRLLGTQNLSSITVNALETVGVEGRGGYYEDTGALKDMLPHLYSLSQLCIQELLAATPSTWLSEKILVNQYVSGQYQSYKSDLAIPISSTESYFQTSLNITNAHNQTIQLRYESGKKLASKLTSITANFTNNSSVYWELQPTPHIVINNVSFAFNPSQYLDHTRTFEMLLQGNTSRFVSVQNITASWELHESVKNFRQNNNISAKMYQNNSYPPIFIPSENSFKS